MNSYKKVLIDAMGIKEQEKVLIFTDDNKINIANKLYEEAKNIAKESYLFVMKPRRVSGEQLPLEVEELMKSVDVVIAATTVSMTHTNAKVNALKSGTRVASMPGITEDMFENGAINANYDEVIKLTEVITEKLTKAKYARIEKDGYTLNLNLDGRSGVSSPGVYKNKGEGGNLPSGEAYIAPIETGVNGKMLIDGSMVGIGLLKKPLLVEIENGKIVKLEGDDDNKLSILFVSEENHTIAELGIGTNSAARLTGVILEDEKIYGTVHIAFGTNTSFGGKNQASCHLDGIILNPTLYLDDEKLLENGRFL
ncbi:aminopeptidase [Anaerococcus faecalis]|nr:aminopeptidase [Anaerococcus faecalis]